MGECVCVETVLGDGQKESEREIQIKYQARYLLELEIYCEGMAILEERERGVLYNTTFPFSPNQESSRRVDRRR